MPAAATVKASVINGDYGWRLCLARAENIDFTAPVGRRGPDAPTYGFYCTPDRDDDETEADGDHRTLDPIRAEGLTAGGVDLEAAWHESVLPPSSAGRGISRVTTVFSAHAATVGQWAAHHPFMGAKGSNASGILIAP